MAKSVIDWGASSSVKEADELRLNMQTEWEAAQRWELDWWLSNPGEYAGEIRKSTRVAQLLMLGTNDVRDKRVLDVGCGPFSLLHFIPTAPGSVALDSLYFGAELEQRYLDMGIRRIIKCGEELDPDVDGTFDEVWIYNCLQHVRDPTKILENAIKVSKRVRIFEWVYIAPYEGHLHRLTPPGLAEPFGRAGWTTKFSLPGSLNNFEGLDGNFAAFVFDKPSSPQ
jgi:SAM-dependent methyltransferase